MAWQGGQDRKGLLSLRARIEKARKISNDTDKGTDGLQSAIKALLPPESGSRLDAKRRRFLQGMHKDKHESQSITISSATAHFERDRMLYYKAIKETGNVPLDFISSLRKAGPRPDDTCTRQQQLQRAKTQFVKTVANKQAVASACQEDTMQLWSSFQQGTACNNLAPDVSPTLHPRKIVLGRRCTPPIHSLLPPTPIEEIEQDVPVTTPASISPAIADQVCIAPRPDDSSDAGPRSRSRVPRSHAHPRCTRVQSTRGRKPSGVDEIAQAEQVEAHHQQQCTQGQGRACEHEGDAANPLPSVADPEVPSRHRSRSRSPSRHSHSGHVAQHIMPNAPPVNPRSWAAANSLGGKSLRYRTLNLPLAPNVAIRPDHGQPWDIHDGTHNMLISDDSVDSRTLQAVLEGGWLRASTPKGQQRCKELQPRGRFLKEAKRKLLEKAAAACNLGNDSPPMPDVWFADLEDSRGCKGGVARKWVQSTPFLEWVHACIEASKRPAATAAALTNGIVTSTIKSRNDFLMPVFDDGTGEVEISGHARDNLAFRKGRIGVVQFVGDRPENISWDQPFQYQGRKVREQVTDAIEQAKLLRMFDRQLVPVAARGRRSL